MTLSVFFGCTFIAFGPALGLFLFTIARDPLRIIILIAGAFFWLVSLLLSSLIWFIAVKASDPQDEPLQKGLLIFGVMFSVLLQEVFRFLYYKLLRKAIEGLVALSEDGCSPISIQQMAYVAGVGFGLMSGAFSMINLLADSLGPGTVGIHGDSQLYFLTSDVLQPPVRGQPGALLPADGCCRCLGLPTVRGICPEPATLPALSTEWSQPPAGILRPCGCSCPQPPLPSPPILAARAAVTFSAISFLLDWRTPASPGGAGAGVWLWQPADRCGWGWLTPMPLWEPPEDSSVLGDLALLALP
ncbi:gamma-secretase subunit Aph-1b-like isoform 1-T1 [Spheniscus humboldti]